MKSTITWNVTTDPRTVNDIYGLNQTRLGGFLTHLRDKYNQNIACEYHIPDGKWLGYWVLRGDTPTVLNSLQQWIIKIEEYYLEQYRRGNIDMKFDLP